MVALYFRNFMKKIYLIFSIFVVFLFVGCKSEYVYKDVTYFINSIEPKKKSPTPQELKAVVAMNFGVNGLLIGEAADKVLSNLTPDEVYIYTYTLLLDDDTISYSGYPRIFLTGPKIYEQYDVVKVRAKCKKSKNGKFRMSPDHLSDLSVKGLWY